VKKLFLLLPVILFLNGCVQTTSMMGPTYTLVKTGSVVQAGSSIATSYGIKSTLGQSPTEIIFSFAKKENSLSFENLLKLAMNYLDKDSSNLAR